jgi:hypothetical protein
LFFFLRTCNWYGLKEDEATAAGVLSVSVMVIGVKVVRWFLVAKMGCHKDGDGWPCMGVVGWSTVCLEMVIGMLNDGY